MKPFLILALAAMPIALPFPALAQQPALCLQTLKEVQSEIGRPLIRIEENGTAIEFTFDSRQSESWEINLDAIASAFDYVIANCEVNAVIISINRTGNHRIYGNVNGQNQWFKCKEPGRNSSLQWGEQYCGL